MQSFDANREPPGRPVPPPPINTAPPTVAMLDGVAVGDQLLAAVGSWTGGPGITYERAWYRGGRAIPGATDLSYVIQPADTGYMLTFAVRATTPAGAQNLAGATAVGPCVPASPRARKGRLDDSKTKAPQGCEDGVARASVLSGGVDRTPPEESEMRVVAPAFCQPRRHRHLTRPRPRPTRRRPRRSSLFRQPPELETPKSRPHTRKGPRAGTLGRLFFRRRPRPTRVSPRSGTPAFSGRSAQKSLAAGSGYD